MRFADASHGSPFKTALGDLRIDVNGLGSAKGKKADALVAFSTEAGEAFELKGNLTLSPLASEGTVALGKVVLKKYAPYFSDAVRFDIQSGTLDARSGYRFAQGEGGPEFRLSGLGASVSGLRLRQREEKEEFLVVPEFAVKEVEVDPAGKADHDRRDRHGERIGRRAPFRRRGNERLPPGAGRAGKPRSRPARRTRGRNPRGKSRRRSRGRSPSGKRSSTGTP